jgi:hypothetical protein
MLIGKEIKMGKARTRLCIIGATIAVIGDGLAYYFNTATHMEGSGIFTYEVLTYGSDYVTGAIALAIIGVIVLLASALSND